MLKIALTCSFNDGNYFIKPRYPQYLTEAAERYGYDIMPVVLPITDKSDVIERYAREFDGFLFTGGDDVYPPIYGEEKLDCCGDVETERDEYEIKLLGEIIKLDKPVFGICRGIQIMNVALGGTLWQDITTQLLGGKSHAYKDENCRPAHVVKTSGFVSTLAGADEIVTNSYHHQSLKKLGEGFEACAVSCDGIIEAAEHTSLRYYKAVQWHPEMNPTELSYRLAGDFLSAVQESAK